MVSTRPGLTSPPLQGKKTVAQKKASKESTALPRETASIEDQGHPHSKAPDGGPCGAGALTTQLPVDSQEPDEGIGESNLITSLVGLCKSKVLDRVHAGRSLGDSAQVRDLKLCPCPLERSCGSEGPGESPAPCQRGSPGSRHLPGAEQPLLPCDCEAPLPAVSVLAHLSGPCRHCCFRGYHLEVGTWPGKGLHLQGLEALPVLW